LFTTTGKWHFPDADDVQNQLFENIAWLFDKRLGKANLGKIIFEMRG